MVKNASGQLKSVGGRPVQFDRSAVVSAAMATFWAKGFHGTTLGDLERSTGVDRSSLYKSFGGKKGLYESAADAYLAMADGQLFCWLHEGSAGVEDILRFFDTLGESLLSDAPDGCFIINDMIAVQDFEPASRYMHRLQTGFEAALGRAVGAGQVKSSMVEQRTQLLTSALLGLNMVHRSTPGPNAAVALLDGVRAEVSGWVA